MTEIAAEQASKFQQKAYRLLRKIHKDSYIYVGGLLVSIFIIIAILAPLLAPHDPDRIDPVNRLASVSTEGYPLGTDHLGRDLLSRLIYGSRITILAGAGAALLAMILGVTVGIFAAMGSQRVDNLVMRIIDVLMAFPAILLAILIVAFLGPGIRNAMLAVAIVNIPFYARLTRSVTLSTKEKEYIEASQALGNKKVMTIIKHIIPNISPYIIVQTMMNIGWMITETASLSFLGLGAQPPAAEWGSMLGEARSILTIAPWVVTFPGLCIFFTVLGFNLLGDGLRDRWDPKI